jgi:hypothetical protein
MIAKCMTHTLEVGLLAGCMRDCFLYCRYSGAASDILKWGIKSSVACKCCSCRLTFLQSVACEQFFEAIVTDRCPLLWSVHSFGLACIFLHAIP